MAYCKRCKKEVEPELHGSRYLCPDCQKFIKVGDDEKEEPQVVVEKKEEEKPTKGREILTEQEGAKKIVTMGKNIRYDASDLHMGEILINLGFAKDLNDLSRKNMKLAFSLMNMGAIGKDINTMENKEPDPERTMKEIQQQEMMKAYIESMKSGNQMDPMSMMMLMKMMDNQAQGKSDQDNGMMNKTLEMQMMKSLMGGQNPEMASLQREIADLKHQASMYQVMQQQQQSQQGNKMSQDYMMKMEKLKSDRDTEIKNIELQAQQQRDENIRLMFDSKLQEIQANMNRAIEEGKRKGQQPDLKNFKDQFMAVKEVSKMIGDKDKSTSENIMEGFTNVANTVGPPLVEVLKQRQQQRYPMQPQFPPESAPIHIGNPGPTPVNPRDPEPAPIHTGSPEPTPVSPRNPEPVTESGRPIDTGNPDDLTASEREWSNTMERMYLRPSGKKKE